MTYNTSTVLLDLHGVGARGAVFSVSEIKFRRPEINTHHTQQSDCGSLLKNHGAPVGPRSRVELRLAWARLEVCYER